jgi:type IV pilus assembly protein PilM
MWKRGTIQPIGLDLGRHSIKLLQVEAAGETARIRTACRRVLPVEARSAAGMRGEVIAPALKRMLDERPPSGRRVVASLPRSLVQVKSFRLPQMPLEELESAARFEARHLLDLDADHATVHCLAAGDVRQGSDTLQEVIVVAASSQHTDELVELLHRCGLTVDSIDVEPCAIFRGVECFLRRREDEQEVHFLADVGYSGTQVVIGRGRDISFLKTIEIGGAHLNEAVAKGLGLPVEEAEALRRRIGLTELLKEGGAKRDAADAGSVRATGAQEDDSVERAVFDAARSVLEQLARELSLCLRYQSVTFRGQRPTRVRLFGGEAGDTHLRRVLGSAVPIPIEPGRPLLSVDCAGMGGEAAGDMGAWAVALGLSLRRFEGRFKPRDGKPRTSIAQPAAALPGDWEASPGERPGRTTVKPELLQESPHA